MELRIIGFTYKFGMMRYWRIFISLLILGCLRIVSPACQKRNVNQAEAEDPTRICRKECKTTNDCTGVLKKCQCDDRCGLSCFNPDAPCPNITETLGNGTIRFSKNAFKYDSQASYSCNAGYGLRGVSSRICRSNRKWSHQPPVCIRSCPFPKVIGNSHVRYDTIRAVYEPGDVASYKCQLGRIPSGNPNVTCQSSYTWSTLHLQCIRKDCGDPPAVQNGDYTPKGKTKFADQITYFCLKGFQNTDGRLSNLCDASGNWRSLPPTCDRVLCAPPITQIKNGKVSLNGGSSPWEYEDKITVSCEDGYLIDGKVSSLTLKCNENGTWGERPSCKGDLNAEFNNELEGYTSVSGSFISKRYDDDVGIPNYGVFGSGVFISVPYQTPSSGKTCMQVDILTDAMVAQATSDNTVIDLMRFQATGGWRTRKYWLVPPRVNLTEVQLQFSAPMNSWIDNIKVVANDLCATLPLPKQIAPSEPPSTTATTPKAESTKGVESTTKKGSTTASNAVATTEASSPTVTPTTAGRDTRQGTEAATGARTSTAKPDQTTPNRPDIPGRNGRPGEPVTTTEILTTRPSPHILRDLLIGIGCLAGFLGISAVIFHCCCIRNNTKRVDSSTTTPMVTTGSGSNPAPTTAPDSSPSSNDKLIATEAV